MSKPITVAVTNGTLSAIQRERELLTSWNISYVTGSCKTVEETVELCRNAEAVLTVSAPFTREVMVRLPHCRIIIRYGIGIDTIDVEAATESGIMVVNIPDYGVNVVADHTVALLLALERKIPQVIAHVKQGGWGYPALGSIKELQGKTLGLAGFGNIARAVAKRMRAFDMRVIAYDPFIPANEFARRDTESVSWPQLLQQSDILSLHLPLTADTKHLLNRESIKRMKPSASLINTARGGIVETEALAEALSSGKLAGAALDVLEHEPAQRNNPLLALNNCLITSHCAAYAVESMMRIHEYAGLELARYLRGEQPKHVVNRAMLDISGGVK